MEIDKEMHGRIQGFIKGLTKASDGEIQQYVSEILSDKEFHDSIAKKRNAGSGRKYFSLMLAIDVVSRLVLYSLCRKLKPSVIVETGVASGMSSAYILRALDKNNHGELFSIDVPWHTVTENWKPHFSDEDMTTRPIEKQSGWIIPDYLRDRWQLFLGKSSENLPPLLKKIEAMDVFLHDSEHTYETMLWEFQTAWPNLRAGGMLIAHNVDSNDAFSDFGQSVGGESILLTGMHKGKRLPPKKGLAPRLPPIGGMVKV